jgi:hypothetical protein
MASEELPPERAYPYRNGWHVVGCAVMFFGLVGGIGVSLFPTGYEKFRAGQLPTGIALMVIGVFGVPTLGMALWSLIKGVLDAFRPPLVRVTATALVLPTTARGEPPRDDYGEPISKEPPHPETLPFTAIRRAVRTGPRLNAVLEIVHDLSAAPLILQQHMMRVADFEELEQVLRAAVPGAFTVAPTRS